MNKITRLAITGVAVAGLTLVGAMPAQAADTTATVEVQGGVLSIEAPGSVSLSSVIPGGTATGTLTGVAVTDATADAIGWTASVTISDFTSGVNTIPASAVTYVPTTAQRVGTATVTESTATSGTGTVQTATAVTGNNTATWGATLSVQIPTDALAASDYTAILTHSVI